jgi:hypothetical protein
MNSPLPLVIDVDSIAAATRARMEHVSRRGQELADLITEWRATDPIGMKTKISEDRLNFEARWQVSPASFEHWALIFADGIHHLRAALDNCLYAIAQQSGATVKQLTAVQFPIVSDGAKWSSERRRIEMLPDGVRDVIESLQPFQEPDPMGSVNGLVVLSSLNNSDKHHIILTSLIQPKEIEHQFQVAFEDGRSVDGPPPVEYFNDVVDGALAVRVDGTPDRIAGVSGGGNFSAQVMVKDDAGRQWGMTSTLAELAVYVPAVVEGLLTAC